MNQFARPGLAVTQLPSFNENDKGKVLTINSESGALGWEEGSGGGSSLPTDPAQDGTYNLQNTVSSGTSTLSWASGGSSGGVLVVNITNGTSNKTWQAIWDAYASGAGCKFVENFDEYTTAEWYLATVKEDRGSYIVELFTADINDNPVSILPATLSCDSASGYPTGSLG